MQKLWVSCRNLLLLAIFAIAFKASATIVPCDVWDYDEPIETENGIGLVSGLSLKYHPRNPVTGLIDYETYLAWTVGRIEETCHQNMTYLEPRCVNSSMWHKCDNEVNYASAYKFAVFRAMVPAELVCYKSRGYRMIDGYINETYIAVEAKWPAFPNFSLRFEVQTVSHNYTSVMGSGPLTDGYEYRINHVYVHFDLKKNLLP